jgi:beta-lactamase superfamily II metal-dependent hydrolase
VIGDADVLKAPHHGSRTGFIPSWLARTRPEVVAISVGAGNTYGLPDEDALAAYGEGGRAVLRTDLNGDIASSHWTTEAATRSAPGARARKSGRAEDRRPGAAAPRASASSSVTP